MEFYMLFVSLIWIFVVSGIHGGVIPDKRDAFDPNRLMEDYMHVRTNQNQFGSFHPNDLISTIDQYFKNGGSQEVPNNQWGLSLYNPNNAIGQYMGDMQSPGTLGPDPVPHTTQSEQVQSIPHGTAFNPNALNEKLMQTAQSDSGATHGAVFGFDPDSVNRQLMADAKSHTQNAEFVPNENHGSNGVPNENHGSNGQSTAHEFGGTGSKTSTMVGHLTSGFNPDILNAGLYNTMSYDPNSVNSAIIGLGSGGSSYGNIGTLNSKELSETSLNSQNTNPSTQKQDGGIHAVDNGATDDKRGQQSNAASATTSLLAHAPGRGSGTVGITDNSPFSETSGAITPKEALQKPGSTARETTNTNTFHSGHALTHPLQQIGGNVHSVAQATNTDGIVSNPFFGAGTLQTEAGTGSGSAGIGRVGTGTGSTGSGSVGTGTGSAGSGSVGTGTGSTGIGSVGTGTGSGAGSFSAGALGPQGSTYQNQRAPPGLPSGGELKQTEPGVAVASGIGGMG